VKAFETKSSNRQESSLGVGKQIQEIEMSSLSHNNVASDRPLKKDDEVLETERPLIVDEENSKSQNLNDAEKSIITIWVSQEKELSVSDSRNRVPSQCIPMHQKPLKIKKNNFIHSTVEIDDQIEDS